MSRLSWSILGLIVAGCAGLDATTSRRISASPTPTAKSNAIAPADLTQSPTGQATGSATESVVPTEAPSSMSPSVTHAGTLTTGRNLRVRLRYRSGSGNEIRFSIDGEPNSNPENYNPGRGPFFNFADAATSSVSGSTSIEISVVCTIDPGGYLLGVPGSKTCKATVIPKPGSQGQVSKAPRFTKYEDLDTATSSWAPRPELGSNVEVTEGESMVMEFYDNDQRKPVPGRWAKLTFTTIDNLFVVLNYAYRAEPGYLALE